MAGILYVVATPIGNLEDVTLRALRILREVSLIAAEDTRRTARLLQHYSISTRTTSLHEHNERVRTRQLVERLQSGDSVALVSDAGTPLVSDPGHHLVQAAREAGIRIEPVPGASAVMAALAASGWGGDGFTFLGFPPTRSKDRKMWFNRLADIGQLTVIFEAPHRIGRTLVELAAIFGGEHIIAIGRELTKSHEELVVRPISAMLERFHDPRGEFTLLIPPLPASPRGREEGPTTELLADELGQILESGTGNRREALRILAERYQLPVNDLYRLLKQPLLGGQKP